MSSDGAQMLSDDYRYVCTSPHVNHPDGMNKEVGACSRMRPYWCNDDECSDCCDRKFCNNMPPAPPPPPAPRPTPLASGCSRVCSADEQAAMAAQGVMCGASTPYMCVDGTAFGGCSSDPVFWTTTSDCNTCCDTSR
jgi:hypothetical protein